MPLATVDSLVEALRGRAILNPKQLDQLSRVDPLGNCPLDVAGRLEA